MKTNKKYSLGALAALMILTGSQLFAHSSAAKSPSGHDISPATRSVQVDQVDPGDVDIEPAFRVAIYENLLVELAKTRQFKQVFRSGDRDAGDIPDLLVLKTTVQRYTPGSETRRAVTTVAGATKLNVRTRLCTRQGQVLERVVNGNVWLFRRQPASNSQSGAQCGRWNQAVTLAGVPNRSVANLRPVG